MRKVLARKPLPDHPGIKASGKCGQQPEGELRIRKELEVVQQKEKERRVMVEQAALVPGRGLSGEKMRASSGLSEVCDASSSRSTRATRAIQIARTSNRRDTEMTGIWSEEIPCRAPKNFETRRPVWLALPDWSRNSDRGCPFSGWKESRFRRAPQPARPWRLS